MAIFPTPRPLDELGLPQPLQEPVHLLLHRVALDELGLHLGLRDVEGLDVDPVPELGGVEAQVGRRPDGHLLAGGHHDLAQLGVAGLAQLVGHGHHRRQGRLHRLEAVQEHPLGHQLAVLDLHVLDDGDAGDAQQLGQGGPHHAHVPVHRLAAGDDQVVGGELLDGGRQHLGRHPVVGLVEGGVVDQVAVVGAHGQAVLDGIAEGVGPHGQDADLDVAQGVADAQGRLHADGVELAGHGSDAGGGYHLLGRLVHPELGGGRLGVGHLLHAADDVQSHGSPPLM